MLLNKWAWVSFFKHPLQIVFSLLLITSTFAFTGLYIVIISYNPSEIEEMCYFSQEIEKDSYFSKNIYMQFIYGNESNAEEREILPLPETLVLTKELHSLGQGYSVDYMYWDTENRGVGGSEYQDEPLIGLYDIEDYIAKEDQVNTLYNSEGEIAPYFKYIIKVREDGYKEQTGAGFHIFFKNISVYYDMDEKSLETYGYTLYGKFPEDTYDITIPWYLYKSFESYGYKNGANGEKIEINSPEDMIGKELSLSGHTATVVGVLNTNQDLSDYLKLENVTDYDIEHGHLNVRSFGIAPVCSTIVSEEYYNSQVTEEKYCTRVSVYRQSSQKLKDAYFDIGTRYRKDMTFWEIRNDNELHVMVDLGRATNVYMMNYGYAILTAQEPFPLLFKMAIPFGIVLAAFLLTINLQQSKRQFSVLRSLGAKKKNLFLAYFLPVAVIMLFAVALSFLGTIISSYNLLQWSYADIFGQFHIDFTLVYVMNGTAALTLVLSGLTALAVCAVSLWINVHAMKFDRVGKKKDTQKNKIMLS